MKLSNLGYVAGTVKILTELGFVVAGTYGLCKWLF